jgi:hypothetical protein
VSQRISPDGMYYWNGAAWVSTVSPDGRYRWDGASWVPVTLPPYAVGAPQRIVREPTSWTRPLQIAVIVWYGFSALVTVTSPFWMGDAMNQIVNQTIQRQDATGVEPLPPGFADTMTAMMAGVLWVSAIIGIAIAAVAIVAAIRRWTWAYYAIMALLGLGLLGVPVDIADAVGGGMLNATQGFSLPIWIVWFAVATGLVDGALLLFMIVGLVRIGPWGMRRVSQ